MEKLSLSAWLDEANASNLSFGRFCLHTQAQELELTETELLERMKRALSVMQEAIAYGLSGVRSTGGLVGGAGLQLQHYSTGEQAPRSLLGPLAAKAAAYALAANEANA